MTIAMGPVHTSCIVPVPNLLFFFSKRYVCVLYAPQVPFVRQLWWWLGLRPVSRALMDGMLSRNISVVFCPGGVQVRAARP